MIEEYSLQNNLIGLVFDTTSSNTSLKKGAVYKVMEYLDKDLLALACRHHVMELRIEKFYSSVTEESTSGPDNLTFKELKSRMENSEFEIDYSNLSIFDKKKVIGTFVEDCTTREAELFCRELAELVLIYLGNSTL